MHPPQPSPTFGRLHAACERWKTGPQFSNLLHDLHPLRGLALLYAAIAGVYLFLSGLISGYYDNLSLYHRVPVRLRRVK